MSPNRISRRNEIAFSIRKAALARLTSEPKCRSERITVSKHGVFMIFFYTRPVKA